MKIPAKKFIQNNFEVIVFSTGLILLAFMNPDTASGPGFCLLERMGFSFCPGDGLGHSIAYTFRGEFDNALQANVLGPMALVILSSRIIQLLFKNQFNHNKKKKYYGSND